MSEEQLKAFLEKVKGDTTLQEQLKAASDSEAVVAIAKEAGFLFSVNVLLATKLIPSEAELESISGGQRTWSTDCPGTYGGIHTCEYFGCGD